MEEIPRGVNRNDGKSSQDVLAELKSAEQLGAAAKSALLAFELKMREVGALMGLSDEEIEILLNQNRS